MGEPTVLASVTDALLRGATASGLPEDALRADSGLDGYALEDPEARVPARLHIALWDAVLSRTEDPAFGLKLAEREVSAATYGVLGYLAKTARDVDAGFRVAIDHLRLTNERAVGDVEEDGGRIRYSVAPMATTGAARHHTEMMLAALLVLARRWSKAHVRPVEVTFRHPAPAVLDGHEALFGCPVLFGAPSNSIVLDQVSAATRLTTADPTLHTILRRRVESLIAALPARSDLLRDVENIIREHLAEGAPTVAFIARQLGLSSRTLQRRLAGEGVSYASLLDRYRRETALKLLDDERLAIHDISLMLGFSEPKAFRRAFKRWTGNSPRAHRNLRRLGHLSAAA